MTSSAVSEAAYPPHITSIAVDPPAPPFFQFCCIHLPSGVHIILHHHLFYRHDILPSEYPSRSLILGDNLRLSNVANARNPARTWRSWEEQQEKAMIRTGRLAILERLVRARMSYRERLHMDLSQSLDTSTRSFSDPRSRV